ncbi:MAG: fibronectin type III domain-containing protein [Anaerolineae bacterium]
MKVYVMLGFHTSFHHSWRGDTPDEAGFGTDIRVVRQILRLLAQAKARGQEARSYWDLDVYWTLQQIIPHHAPDILKGIRQRVQAGHDEIVLGPYNNGANHAATESELRAAVAYAFENPYGSGLRQIFGRVSTLYRPQEGMYTAGQNAILLDEGVSGLVLYYAAVPFNALSTFVPALPPEQRYNPLWLRAQPDEPPVVLWPCISPPDLVENVSLEALLLKLRRLQTSGQVQSDLLVHLNFDADGETWLPVDIPGALAWFPNTGGLVEYIQVVNRYPWAEFTVPSEYGASHPPQGEVLVRQDLADGGFDGNYSWAEKYTSLCNWTALEQSRLHTYRADALARRFPGPVAERLHHRLWEGADSVFFQRLVGLTTTHFGMSTPVINEERQAKAGRLLGRARDRAAEAEREAARTISRASRTEGEESLYVFEAYRPACEGQQAEGAVQAVVRLPLILPPGIGAVRVEAAEGKPVAASLVDPRPLLDGRLAGELLLADRFHPTGSRLYRVAAAPTGQSGRQSPNRLRNRWLDLRLSAETGVASLTYDGHQVGAERFLEPFITYRGGRRPQRWRPYGYRIADLSGEQWDGLSRARLRTQIVMDTPHGLATSDLTYTFTLFDHLPYLLLDVAVEYARTRSEDAIQTLQQQLRRLLDLRWIEVAPCQLNPEITGGTVTPADRRLRIWKHNYLGVTSHYDLDYGRINPRNRDLDSFNHQVTAGWVAVSDGQLGLLLAESAEHMASMAFCPMRLREREGVQRLSLNPFGSYHGRQLDYRHLGGNGLGAEFTTAASGSLRPNGPSFNGQRLAFSLLLAPYAGDEPPAQIQADAWSYFYSAGVIYHQAPPGVEAVVPRDLQQLVKADRRERRRQKLRDAPLPPPDAFLANPADGAVDLVWRPPHDSRLTGHEVRWRRAGDRDWQGHRIGPASAQDAEGAPDADGPQVNGRWRVDGLRNGESYSFQVRALAGERTSVWTAEAEAVPGAVEAGSLLSMMPATSPWSLVRLVGYSLASVVRARLGRQP